MIIFFLILKPLKGKFHCIKIRAELHLTCLMTDKDIIMYLFICYISRSSTLMFYCYILLVCVNCFMELMEMYRYIWPPAGPPKVNSSKEYTMVYRLNASVKAFWSTVKSEHWELMNVENCLQTVRDALSMSCHCVFLLFCYFHFCTFMYCTVCTDL